MGTYTDNLHRRQTVNRIAAKAERLIGVAIQRSGRTFTMSKGSHAQLRNYEPAECGDVEGFMTSNDRFVTRDQAKSIGEAAGQCRPTVRTLLSSDIDW